MRWGAGARLGSRCPFRHAQGGTGCASAHSPRWAVRAAASSCASVVSRGAYGRYHQAAGLDQLLVEAPAIGELHVTDEPPIPIRVAHHDGDRLLESQGACELPRLRAEGLRLFLAYRHHAAGPSRLYPHVTR